LMFSQNFVWGPSMFLFETNNSEQSDLSQ
jgi:hypothetical protein